MLLVAISLPKFNLFIEWHLYIIYIHEYLYGRFFLGIF